MNNNNTKFDALGAYRIPAEAVLRLLQTDARDGLREDEAQVRLARHGCNELPQEKQTPGAYVIRPGARRAGRGAM